MLTLASNRAIQENVSINWIAGDMLDLTDIGNYQAVTCFSDSLCYMGDVTQVKQVFEGVYDLLEVSGTFVFDVHSTHQMFERIDELHKERTYPLETYQKMLTEVGFKFEVFADFTDEAPSKTSKRWFFVCQK